MYTEVTVVSRLDLLYPSLGNKGKDFEADQRFDANIEPLLSDNKTRARCSQSY